MPKLSMWWLFLTLFGLTIGGIQSLGWWTRPASAQSPSVQAQAPTDATASIRHRNCEVTHWRSIFMQQ